MAEMSKFIWQHKKTKVKLKILWDSKEKEDLQLPN